MADNVYLLSFPLQNASTSPTSIVRSIESRTVAMDISHDGERKKVKKPDIKSAAPTASPPKLADSQIYYASSSTATVVSVTDRARGKQHKLHVYGTHNIADICISLDDLRSILSLHESQLVSLITSLQLLVRTVVFLTEDRSASIGWAFTLSFPDTMRLIAHVMLGGSRSLLYRTVSQGIQALCNPPTRLDIGDAVHALLDLSGA